MRRFVTIVVAIAVAAAVPVLAGAAGLIHDAEYYILEAQHSEAWKVLVIGNDATYTSSAMNAVDLDTF